MTGNDEGRDLDPPPLLPDQTHLSLVQEVTLSWQPHTCKGKAGVMPAQ